MDDVLNRGVLVCGVNPDLLGFSFVDPQGRVRGFDVDFCRAVAAAVLGDSSLVGFVQLGAAQRFQALKERDIDVLFRNTTWTQGRDATFDFGPTTYYDGQKIMGLADQDGDGSPDLTPSSTLHDIEGASVCAIQGTTSYFNLIAVAQQEGVSLNVIGAADLQDKIAKLISGECGFDTSDESGLVASRKIDELLGIFEPGELVIFPKRPISKEPLGPVYRANDSLWSDVIRWTVFATILAEEYAVTSENIDAVRDANFYTRALFGGPGEVQTAMGLAPDAFYQVIKQVGNYGEIFRRNLGKSSPEDVYPLDIERSGSLNALFTSGGLMYAPPARGPVP